MMRAWELGLPFALSAVAVGGCSNGEQPSPDPATGAGGAALGAGSGGGGASTSGASGTVGGDPPVIGGATAGGNGGGGAPGGAGAASGGAIDTAGAAGNGGGAVGTAGSTSGTGGASEGRGGAGSGGGPSPGGAGGGAGSKACPGLFCEDFESGEVDAGKWTLSVSGANTASVQTARAAHGGYAARFHYAGARATWAFLHASLPVALVGHQFGRAYVFLTPALPDRHTVLVTAGTAGFPTDKYLEVAGQGTAFQLTAVDLSSGGGESYQVGGTLLRDRWFCLEWEFTDSPDQAVLFIDGQQALAAASFTINGSSSGLVGGFSRLGIGFRAWGSGAVDPSYDLYYDDIVVDTARVGCL